MLLAEHGPALKRPVVGEITGSRHANMKELRRQREELCEFSSRSIRDDMRFSYFGGDKSGEWNKWYRTAIPQAEELYDTHLKELRDEGLIDH